MNESAHGSKPDLKRIRLYLISDAFPKVQPLERFLSEAIAGGVDMVQLREKSLDDKHLLEAATRCAGFCRQAGVPFVVNDRVDIALASGATGVHLGQDDLPPRAAREIAGAGLFIGLSTHTAQQVDEANTIDVDYIGVGPIHATPTKPGRASVGIKLVRYAAQHARVPFFAIGGLDPENVGEAVGAGAEGISVLRWISQANEPQAAAQALLGAIERARSVATS